MSETNQRRYHLPPLGSNPSTAEQGTTPGSFAHPPIILPGAAGARTFSSPDTPGMPGLGRQGVDRWCAEASSIGNGEGRDLRFPGRIRARRHHVAKVLTTGDSARSQVTSLTRNGKLKGSLRYRRGVSEGNCPNSFL